MRFLARCIEHALNVTVQRLHDADARKHRWAALRRDQDQGFHPLGAQIRIRAPEKNPRPWAPASMAQDGIGDHGGRRLDERRADGQNPEFPFGLGIHRVANARWHGSFRAAPVAEPAVPHRVMDSGPVRAPRARAPRPRRTAHHHGEVAHLP
jgi:hypothetical protein